MSGGDRESGRSVKSVQNDVGYYGETSVVFCRIGTYEKDIVKVGFSTICRMSQDFDYENCQFGHEH